MILETFNPNRINIKSLVLEEPETMDSTIPDPDRLIADHWGVVESVMKDPLALTYSSVGTWAALLKVASPFWYDKLGDTKEILLQKFLDDIAKERSNSTNFGRGLGSRAAYLKILDPEKFQELSIQPDEFNYLKSRVESVKAGNFNYTGVNEDLFTYSLLFPNVDLEDDVWQHLVNHELNGSYSLHRGPTLARMKVAFPERVEQLSALYSWKQLREQLDSVRGWLSIGAFLNHTAAIRILTAEKIIVTESNVELVMPRPQKPFFTPTPLPERRRF